MHNYSLYNNSLQSFIQLSFLRNNLGQFSPQTTIRLLPARFPLRLKSPLVVDSGCQVSPRKFLINLGTRTGRLMVDGTSSILCELGVNPDFELLSFIVCHEVIAAILRHQGYLVLHANAIRIGNKVIIIAGQSGSGKSTTTAGLLENGAQLVADDLTAIRFDASGNLVAVPGLPYLHLTHDVIDRLHFADRWRLSPSPVRTDKDIVHLESSVDTEQKIESLFVLNIGKSYKMHAELCPGRKGFRILQDCIYGPLLPVDAARCFALQSQLVKTVPIIRIERPKLGWSLQELIQTITASETTMASLTPGA
jgi:hypothetical protein